MRFGNSNVRSLYGAGSFTAAARELARYKLDLAGLQEVRGDEESTVRDGDYNHMVGHPRCVFINYIGLINCRTQLICGTYMFIT